MGVYCGPTPTSEEMICHVPFNEVARFVRDRQMEGWHLAHAGYTPALPWSKQTLCFTRPKATDPAAALGLTLKG